MHLLEVRRLFRIEMSYTIPHFLILSFSYEPQTRPNRFQIPLKASASVRLPSFILEYICGNSRERAREKDMLLCNLAYHAMCRHLTDGASITSFFDEDN